MFKQLALIAALAFAVPSPALADQYEQGYVQWGIASWYGPGFIGNQTANGERYYGDELTAAHKRLPFGTRVRVTNIANSCSVVVRINDRGPFIAGRIIDLSPAARDQLCMGGLADVRIEVL